MAVKWREGKGGSEGMGGDGAGKTELEKEEPGIIESEEWMRVEEELLKMERGLSELQGFDGWMIGTCCASLKMEPAAKQDTKCGDARQYTARIIKRGSTSLIIRVEHWNAAEPGDNFLKVLLVNPGLKEQKCLRRQDELKKLKEPKESEESIRHSGSRIRFSTSQTERFLEAAADQNSIHRGPSAIVPGLLMMNRSAVYSLKPDEGRAEEKSCRITLEARFLAPLKVGETAALNSEYGKTGDILLTLSTRHGTAMNLVVKKTWEGGSGSGGSQKESRLVKD